MWCDVLQTCAYLILPSRLGNARIRIYPCYSCCRAVEPVAVHACVLHTDTREAMTLR